MAKTKKSVIDIDFNANNVMRGIASIQNQFVTVYTEDEVHKLIKAFREKYKAGCEPLPYQMRGSKILKGLV